MKRGPLDGFEVAAAALVLAAALVDRPDLRRSLWAGLAHTCQRTAATIGWLGLYAEARTARPTCAVG